jgi:enoyl-CoA hydratase
VNAYETLLEQRAGSVATLVLNRPKVLNALNAQMIRELRDAFAALDGDAGVRAIVLTGSGERAFAAGADIGEFKSLTGALDGAALARAGQALMLQIESTNKPVIAAVNGFALGGGCELAMACDVRLAAATAKFGQPEVNLGLMPGFGGTQRAARLLGRGMAMFLCLSGDQIDAAEALRVGLVDRVVAPEELLPAAQRLAATIAGKAPLAVAATKRAIADGMDLTLPSGLEIEALHFGSLVGTADFAEGTSAFLEKRPAEFTGR